jgi:hypothetical protein
MAMVKTGKSSLSHRSRVARKSQNVSGMLLALFTGGDAGIDVIQDPP